MIELRWHTHPINPAGMHTIPKVLQFREIVTAEGSDYARYGPWQDVPTVTEE